MTPAPAPDEEGIFFDLAPDGDGRNRIYVNFYQAGTFSVEVKKEELERLREQLDKFLISCSRPHTPAPAPAPEIVRIPVGDFEAIKELGFCEGYAAGAKAERERVLDALGEEVAKEMHMDHTAPFNPNDDFIPSIGIDVLAGIIESLRTQQEPQQEGRR